MEAFVIALDFRFLFAYAGTCHSEESWLRPRGNSLVVRNAAGWDNVLASPNDSLRVGGFATAQKGRGSDQEVADGRGRFGIFGIAGQPVPFGAGVRRGRGATCNALAFELCTMSPSNSATASRRQARCGEK